MTPMMCPPGAAGAAPGGSGNIADALTGAPQGAPAGASAAEDDGGFAAFEVALLAILKTATIADDPQASLAGNPVPATPDGASAGSDVSDASDGAVSLSTLWLQAMGRRSTDGAGHAGEAVPEDAISVDAEEDADDVAMATATLTALAAPNDRPVVPEMNLAVVPLGDPAAGDGNITPTSETTEAPVAETSALAGAGARANADASASVISSGDSNAGLDPAPRADTSRAPLGHTGTVVAREAASADEPAGADIAAASAHNGDTVADVPKPDAKPAARGEASALPQDTDVTDRAPGTAGSPAHQTHVTNRLPAHVAARLAQASNEQFQRIPSVTITAQSSSLSASAAGDLPESTRDTPEAGGELTPAQRAAAEALGANLSVAASQPGGSSSGERSFDRSRDDRRGDASWLRRSSSLESRLTPPGSFTMPTAASPYAPAAVLAGAGPVVQAPFEMPAPAENLSKLVQTLKVQARDGVSQASLRLNPEHLGEVTINIRVEGSTVSAVVRAESGDVRQWLRGQEESIRASLAEQGLTLDELVVEQDGERRRSRDEDLEEQLRRIRPRSRASASVFEVTA